MKKPLYLSIVNQPLFTLQVQFMKTGTIKFFNATKGYGFIKDDETGNEIFLHISGLIDQPINNDDRVSFDVQEGKKGLNAVNVKKI